MRVEIVERKRGSETVVAVRSIKTGRVLHASTGCGVLGQALALIEAVSYAARQRHTLVTRGGEVARAA